MKSFCRRCSIAILSMLVGFATFPVMAANEDPSAKPGPNHLRISAARSAHDLQIIEELASSFQQKNPDVTISITSGGVLAVLQQGREGLADVILTHHKPAELKFVADGFALKRTQLMFTEYALFGPPGDELGLTKLKDIASVFKKLAEAEAEFYVPLEFSGN